MNYAVKVIIAMISATLRVHTTSRKVSKAIVDSIGPDNKDMRNLTVKGIATPSEAKISVRYDGKIETFISTMEDLLRCVQAANTTVESIAK